MIYLRFVAIGLLLLAVTAGAENAAWAQASIQPQSGDKIVTLSCSVIGDAGNGAAPDTIDYTNDTVDERPATFTDSTISWNDQDMGDGAGSYSEQFTLDRSTLVEQMTDGTDPVLTFQCSISKPQI
jgi:hypothetical protein